MHIAMPGGPEFTMLICPQASHGSGSVLRALFCFGVDGLPTTIVNAFHGCDMLF